MIIYQIETTELQKQAHKAVCLRLGFSACRGQQVFARALRRLS